MKLITFLLLLTSFGLRFGPKTDLSISSKLFYTAFGLEFSTLVLHIVHCLIILCKEKSTIWNCHYGVFFHCSWHRMFFTLVHCITGILITFGFAMHSLDVVPSREIKGLCGIYCIFSSYTAFRTCRDIFQPNYFEMFGWFEVVFRNIIKLLFVSFRSQFKIQLF